MPRQAATQHDFGAEILRVVRETSREVVEQGLARLEDGEDGGAPFLRLIPANPNAASLTVYADHPTLAMGEELVTTEMFGSEEQRLRELPQLIRSVIAGRYEWEHRPLAPRWLFWRRTPATQLVGTFHTEEGRWVFRWVGGERAGSTERRVYEPYRT